ncbi:MAG: YiiD C-terminal domain-containing protein [Xanthomonadales bacterium]|nr:YiiD C-terminal domain-containing protein [Xanthomonadales bacterium]
MVATATPLVAGTRDALRAALERELLAEIPLARAMQLAIDAWDGESLAITAPLAPNINDKGCAFGGSLAAVMTLAGWALVRLAVDADGLAADIYVQDSTIRYHAPVWGDFRAEARLDAGDAFDGFLAALRQRGKARLGVEVVVAGAGGTATTLVARFVALAHPEPSTAGGDAAQSQAPSAA